MPTEHVQLLGAQPLGGREVPQVTITIGESAINTDNHTALQMTAHLYEEQAAQLAGALERSLPGGTLDRLLGILLLRKASHFVIPWANYGGKE